MSEQNSGGVSLGDQLREKGVRFVEARKVQLAGKAVTSVPPKFNFRQPPALPKIDLTLPAPEQFEQERRNRETFIAQIGPQMHDWVLCLRNLDELPDEDRKFCSETEQQVVGAINRVLSDEDLDYRTSARLAWADALVRTCPARRGPVTETLERFVKDGFLVVVENGEQKQGVVVRIYSKNYTLGVELRKNPQAQAVLEALNQLAARTAERGKKVFQDRVAELEAQVGEKVLTPAEVRAGEDGRAILPVTDKVRESDGRFFRGGPILVEVHEGKVRVLDGAGAVQFFARQLGESGAFLGIGQLANERIDLGTARVPPEVFNRLVAIHDMVRRGLANAEQAEAWEAHKAEYWAKMDAEREELRSKATLSPEEFFEGKIGIAFVDFGTKPYIVRKKGDDGQIREEKVRGVFCLVERRDDGQIRVSECPDRLKTFFGGCQDWASPAERFEGLDQPLRGFLRACYGNSR